MKMPRKINAYCRYCKKHTEHEVHRTKKKKASEMAQGQRRFRRVMRGYRGFPRPKPEGREKTSRRVPIKLTCVTCKKSYHPPSQRSKRFSIE